MNHVGEMVARLVAAGASPEVAAVVVTEAFATGMSYGKSGGTPVDAAAEKRRAFDRERKRLEREALRKSGGTPVEVCGSPEIPSSLTSSPSVSNSEGKEVKKERAKRVPAHPLPDGWEPSDSHFLHGERLGHSRKQILGMAQAMRDWCRAEGHRAITRKSNWDAAFTIWINRAKPPPRPENGSQNGRQANDWDAIVEGILTGGNIPRDGGRASEDAPRISSGDYDYPKLSQGRC